MDEIGKKYGKLTVIRDSGQRNHQTIIYECLCDCGNTTFVDVNKLHSGHTKSCGCLKHQVRDLTGQRFGKLTVIAFKSRESKNTYWICRCDCGNECVATTANLTMGASVSCGCVNAQNQAEVYLRNDGFVNGSNIYAFKPTRKINKNNTSGYRGVRYDKTRKKWVAQIMFQRKSYLLGRFDTFEEALAARKEAEKRIYEILNK